MSCGGNERDSLTVIIARRKFRVIPAFDFYVIPLLDKEISAWNYSVKLDNDTETCGCRFCKFLLVALQKILFYNFEN